MVPLENAKKKLLIFNVHGTLLDCNLHMDKHPNCRIRPTCRTKTRRIFLRPWLQPLLSRCFLNFTVGFWGSKSEAYMDDVVSTMLGRHSGGPLFKPLFVWSGKYCDAVEFEGDKPSSWEKPLSKVYKKWPQFSASNTIIIDNKASRVSCNPAANTFIAKPFYVADVAKLGDDRNYLKCTLWPLLEALYVAKDVTEIHSQGEAVVHDELVEEGPHLETISDTNDSIESLEGEGTLEPRLGFYRSPVPSS